MPYSGCFLCNLSYREAPELAARPSGAQRQTETRSPLPAYFTPLQKLIPNISFCLYPSCAPVGLFDRCYETCYCWIYLQKIAGNGDDTPRLTTTESEVRMAEKVYRSDGDEGRGSSISAPLAQRIQRGIEHHAANGQHVQWIAEDRCKVPSCKHPERFYLVVFGENGERCNCPDFSRNDIGVCKHTIAALISWAHQVEYHVEKRHDSRIGSDVYEVIERRATVERVVGWSVYVGTAYHMKWALEGIDAGRAA